jgi:hypothetical protein
VSQADVSQAGVIQAGVIQADLTKRQNRSSSQDCFQLRCLIGERAPMVIRLFH